MALSTSGYRLALIAVAASVGVTCGLTLQHMKDDHAHTNTTLPYNTTAPTNLSDTLSMLNNTVDSITGAVEKVNETLNTKMLEKFFKATTVLNAILVAAQSTVDTLGNASAKMNKTNLTDSYLEEANATIAALQVSVNETNETFPAEFQNLSAGLSVSMEALENQTEHISALLAGVQAAADVAESISNFTNGAKSAKAEELKQKKPVDPKAACDNASAELAAAAANVPGYIEEFKTLNETYVTVVTTFIENTSIILATMNSSIAEQLESGSLPASLTAELVSAQSVVGALQGAIETITDVLLITILPNMTAYMVPLLESVPDYVEWAQQMIDTACVFPLFANASGAA